MHKPWMGLALAAALLSPAAASRAGTSNAAAQNAQGENVAAIQAQHDRALIRDMLAYAAKNPKADDVDQAYMVVFDKAIEHDWFAEHEAAAKGYLADRPDGPVRSLAMIVATMARSQAGDFKGALAQFDKLMNGLGKTEQADFAVSFSDNLASAAVGAGEYEVARKVYQALIDRYNDDPNLRQKVKNDLARLDRVGKPAPEVAVKDIEGKPFRLDGLRGKYVLIDFWATWCAPCVAEVPRLQAAQAKYGPKGLAIVGVSLDDTKTAVDDFVKARGIPWRQIHNASSEGDLVEAFGVSAIPATFLIDPDGVITRLELRGPALDKALEQILGEKTAAAGQAPTRR